MRAALDRGAMAGMFGLGLLALGLRVASGCQTFGVAPSTDGGASPEADSGFCSTVDGGDVLSCDDFDEGKGMGDWERLDSDPQTIYALDDDHVSPPRSAHLEIEAGTRESPDARLRRTLPGQRSRVSVSGRAKIVRSGAQDRPSWIALDFGELGLVSVLMTGALRETTVDPTDGGVKFGSRTGAGPIPHSDWFAFSLEVDLSKPVFTLTIDKVGHTGPLDSTKRPTSTRVILGPFDAETPTAGWIILYDDIVVRGE